jgi:CheY-like chemotaxis protein
LGDGLAGRRIFLVEDEAIIALAIEDMLIALGCAVVGPALSVREAEGLAREAALDGAVLDINLGGASSGPIAAILRQRAIPFCFSTGYGSAELPAEFGEVPLLQKPYSTESLAAVLRRLFD